MGPGRHMADAELEGLLGAVRILQEHQVEEAQVLRDVEGSEQPLAKVICEGPHWLVAVGCLEEPREEALQLHPKTSRPSGHGV